MDERYDVIRSVRDKRFRYIRNYEPFKPYYQYMNTAEKGRTMQEIRRVQAEGNATAKVARFLTRDKPIEELYDTLGDPHEVNNLAGLPEFRGALERLRQAHEEWVVETGDLGLIPEAEINFRQERIGSAWGILQVEGSPQLMRQIRDGASLSLQAGQALSQLERAAGHQDAAVRYWAATGIGNLGREAPSSTSLMEELLNDESESVRIAAARALCHMDRSEDALPTLVEILDNGSQWARLHAAIVLDEIENQALPAVEEMKRHLTPRQHLVQRGKYTVRALNRALNELLGTNNQVR
jgi:uncharacterized sulfatase